GAEVDRLEPRACGRAPGAGERVVDARPRWHPVDAGVRHLAGDVDDDVLAPGPGAERAAAGASGPRTAAAAARRVADALTSAPPAARGEHPPRADDHERRGDGAVDEELRAGEVVHGPDGR